VEWRRERRWVVARRASVGEKTSISEMGTRDKRGRGLKMRAKGGGFVDCSLRSLERGAGGNSEGGRGGKSETVVNEAGGRWVRANTCLKQGRRCGRGKGEGVGGGEGE